MVDRQLFDAQHLASALGMLGLARAHERWRRRPVADRALVTPAELSPSSAALGW